MHSKKNYHYVCSSYSQPSKRHGGAKYFNAPQTEAEVASRVDSFFDDPDKITRFIAERLESERRRLFSGDSQAHAKALNQRIAKLERMRGNYSLQQAEGLITMSRFRELASELDTQLRSAKKELEKIALGAEHLRRLEREAKYTLDLFAATISVDRLESLSPEMRRKIYHRMGLTVWANPDRTLTIEAVPDANYLPDVDEISQIEGNVQVFP